MVYWIKTHKLILVLIAVILYLLLGQTSISNYSMPQNRINTSIADSVQTQGFGSLSAPKLAIPVTGGKSVADTQNRLVIQESFLSLVVSNVKKTGENIISFTKQAGGFMVQTTYNQPNESPFGTIIVRVPTGKLDEALTYFRSQAMKVTSENLMGNDVTDQYTDIEAKLSTLQKTKMIYESL